MTRFELIKMNQGVLKAMIKNKIRLEEIENLELYEEFIARKKQKEKVGYIMSSLREKYNTTERTIYSIVKRMANNVKL